MRTIILFLITTSLTFGQTANIGSDRLDEPIAVLDEMAHYGSVRSERRRTTVRQGGQAVQV